MMQRGLLVVALGLVMFVTSAASRPYWDDTGVTAAVLFIAAGVLGFWGPRRPWLWALALGVWIPLLGIVKTQNYSTMLALIVSFAGTYAGMAIRTWLLPVRD